ncbi:Acyl-ACP thioesterase [Parelusimicrobium proximum]|uniref:acyl-[acyl-carrier-protein] thioesterase n=1 Tax=Parelusimicrobium proximum TaxID=3228953 RepID=UPI003D185751
MIEDIYSVRYYELNPEGNIPVYALLNYFQASAGHDAHNLGFGWEEFSAQGIAWVITKIQIEILKEAHSVQNLKVKTWPSYSEKVISRRDFIITDESGDVVAKGASWWVVINLERRRPVRLPQAMLDLNPANPEYAAEELPFTSPELEGREKLGSIDVITRLEDLDTNNHVNNSHFSAWALGSVPEETRSACRLSQLIISFKNEALLGDEITVNIYKGEEENSFWHSLIRKSDGKEVSRVYTKWSAK